MSKTLLVGLGVMMFTLPAYAQTLAKVGGVPVTLQQVIAANPLAKTNKKIRQTTLFGLINRQAVINAANRVHLQDSAAYKDQVAQAKTHILVNLAAQNYVKAHPVKPAQVKQEYDKIFGKPMPMEYRLRVIQVATYKDAKAALDQIKKGDSFSVVAAKVSEDKGSAQVGGELGWQVATHLTAPVLKTVKAMKVGQVAGPVALSKGFSLIQLLGERQTPKPSFDDVKAKITNEMEQREWIQHIIKLRSEQNAHLIIPLTGN